MASNRLALVGAAACGLALAGTAEGALTPLAAVFHLDEGSGAQAADATAWANLGSLLGPERIPGRFGGALRFRGADNGVRVERAPELESQRLSVEAWVRSASAPRPYRYIVSQGANDCHTASYGLYSGPGGGASFYVSDGTHFVRSPLAPPSLWDGRWHHLAGTYDGSRVRLYLDGAELGTGTPTTLTIRYELPSLVDHYLGAYRGPCPSSLDFDGDIDEVRSWARPLGPDEIAASAAAGHPSVRRLAVGELGDDVLIYPPALAGGDLRVSIASGWGGQRISGARVEAVDPPGAPVSCSPAPGPTCALALSNGARTAAISLSAPGARGARLRVSLAGGGSFSVDVALSGVHQGPEGGLVPSEEPRLPPPVQAVAPNGLAGSASGPGSGPAAQARRFVMPRIARVRLTRQPRRWLLRFRLSTRSTTAVILQRRVLRRGKVRYLRARLVSRKAMGAGMRGVSLGRPAKGVYRLRIVARAAGGGTSAHVRSFVATPLRQPPRRRARR